MACKNAIDYLKSMKDFQEIMDKIQHKHNVLIE